VGLAQAQRYIADGYNIAVDLDPETPVTRSRSTEGSS
jgi:hypothetical protein